MPDSNNRRTFFTLKDEKVNNKLFTRHKHQYPINDHCNGERFFNVHRDARALGDVITWLRKRKPSKWPQWEENAAFPKPKAVYSESLSDWSVTFINHATALVQIGPYNLLTDPVWSERVSPFKIMGPKRVRDAGIRLEDLPPIHLILLSHDHYDHMDLATLQYINRRDQPRIVTGLGNAPILHQHGMQHVSELDWWQSVTFNELEIYFTPAQHFSGRGLRDRNQTLWGSLWVKTPVGGFYFAGDTGYGSHFKEIAERLGPTKFALLPIGAYEPRWFMGVVHMNPEDAVLAFKDLQAEQAMGIHFNTFQLTDESIEQPVIDLKESLATHNVSLENFWVLKEGESKKI